MMDDVEPPHPFALFDFRWIDGGKHRRRRFLKRPHESGLYGGKGLARPLHSVFLRVPKIDLGDRALDAEQRPGRVEKDDLNPVRHGVDVLRLSSRAEMRSCTTVLIGGFLKAKRHP